MKNIHFFKAYSRLGLKYPSLGKISPNLGVEDASDKILTEQFLKQFKDFKINQFSFSLPEKVLSDKYFKILAKETKEFKDLINQNIKNEETQIIVGGDHSVTLGSIQAVLERIKDPKKMGIIHFDSHGDIHLFKTSPSKNFHGMYLRVLFDTFDVKEVDSLVFNKVPTQNLLDIGNLDLEKPEKDFLKKNKIKTLSQKNNLTSKKTLEFINSFINSFKALHISFDIDVFDKSLAPATGIAGNPGLTREEVFNILKIISHHPNLSFDLTEVNPQKRGAKKTIKLSQELLKEVLS